MPTIGLCAASQKLSGSNMTDETKDFTFRTPIKVERIKFEYTDHTAYTIEPTLDEEWDDLTALSWRAGIALLDTGVTVEVAHGKRRNRKYGSAQWSPYFGYEMRYPGGGHTAENFNEAWIWFNGFTDAFEAMRAMKNGSKES